MGASRDAEYKLLIYKCVSIAKVFSIKWWIIKGDGYANFSHVIPGLHTTWHMCVFHDQYTLTNDVLHITLCVDIISFLLEFSFEFIWIFQSINNEISGFLIEINFIAILNTILFNISTLPVKRYLAMNTIETYNIHTKRYV
jgi:hypothetical protein